MNLKKAVGIRRERPEREGFHPGNDIDRPVSSGDVCADGGQGPVQTHRAYGMGHWPPGADVEVSLLGGGAAGGFPDVVWGVPSDSGRRVG